MKGAGLAGLAGLAGCIGTGDPEGGSGGGDRVTGVMEARAVTEATVAATTTATVAVAWRQKSTCGVGRRRTGADDLG